MRPDLSVELCGIRLANPLLPGSGPPGDGLKKLLALQAAGIGALVTKTVSPGTPDVPRPNMAFDGDLFFNVEKWSTRMPEEWLSQILPALEERSAPLFLSLGYSPKDLEELIPLFDPLVDGFEISTHYIATEESLLRSTVGRARALTKKPLFMKLSWHGGDPVANAAVCAGAGADGITAINSIGPVMAIDIERRSSRLGTTVPYLWLSGPAIKPMALRAVYDIARAVAIPVIACGGVARGADLIEFLLAGATAVQSCTALLRRGPPLVGEIVADVSEWCVRQGVASLAEIVGTVTPHYTKGAPGP